MSITIFTNIIILFFCIISSLAAVINIADLPLFLLSLLNIVFYLVILFFNNIEDNKIKPLQLYINIISIIWIGSRTLYLLFRYQSINFEFLANFNKYDVCTSLLLCILFTITINLGIIFGSKLKLNISSLKPTIFLRKGFRLDSVIYISISYTMWNIILSTYQNKNFIIKQSISFLSLELITFILAALFIQKTYLKESISNRNKMFSFLLITVYVLKRTFIDASKGAIFFIGLKLLTIYLVNKENFKIRFKYLITTVGVSLLSIPLYFIVFGLRYTKKAANLETSNSFITLDISKIQYFISTFIGDSLYDLSDALSKRVSFFDNLNVFFHGSLVNNYMSLNYTFKYICNIIFPKFLGFSFNSAQEPPSTLFRVAYGYIDFERAIDVFHSDGIPIYGFLYANIWLFSFFVVFIIGLMMAIIFRYLSKIQINDINLYKSLFLYNCGEIIFGRGIAINVYTIFFNILIPFIFIYIFHEVLNQISTSKKYYIK